MTTLEQAQAHTSDERVYLHVMQTLPQLHDDGESFRMLWATNYYDGPLSGVGIVNGTPHWFSCIGEGSVGPDPDGTPMAARVFGVVPLTAEEYAELRVNHELFESIVGKRGCTYEDGKRWSADTHIPHTMEDLKARYYDQPQPKRDFRTKEIVGWWAIKYLDFDALILAGTSKEDPHDVG